MSKEVIDSFGGEYSFLSNFFPCKIEYERIHYPTTEHAYQAAKSLDVADRQRVALLISPASAKKIGRTLNLRPDWESVRLKIMEEILLLKFQKTRFCKLLLETGDRQLVEGNYWNDTFWGVCRGKGENHLGKLLMKIRDHLRRNHAG